RGIGETSVERLGLHALAEGWTLWQAVERGDALDDLPGAAREGGKALERLRLDLRRRLVQDRERASGVARDLCDAHGSKRELDENSGTTNAAARRWGNVEALLRTFSKKEERDARTDGGASDVRALAAFLHALTLSQEDGEADPSDAVTLSTLHGSKGLEFD